MTFSRGEIVLFIEISGIPVAIACGLCSNYFAKSIFYSLKSVFYHFHTKNLTLTNMIKNFFY